MSKIALILLIIQIANSFTDSNTNYQITGNICLGRVLKQGSSNYIIKGEMYY